MRLSFLVIMILATVGIKAQDIFMTRTGEITFFSSTPLEDIEAENKSVTCILKGDKVAIKVLMKSFMFEKAAMQQHFNDDYVESDEFPNATFEGVILNFDDIDKAKDGEYTVTTEGNLTIHGVTNPIKQEGTLTVKGKEIAIATVFKIELSDYDISVPSNYLKKISNTIEIKVNANLQPYVR